MHACVCVCVCLQEECLCASESALGFGDVVMPSLLVAFAMRFDCFLQFAHAHGNCFSAAQACWTWITGLCIHLSVHRNNAATYCIVFHYSAQKRVPCKKAFTTRAIRMTLPCAEMRRRVAVCCLRCCAMYLNLPHLPHLCRTAIAETDATLAVGATIPGFLRRNQYGVVAMTGYVSGLLCAFIVLYNTESAQPALLYVLRSPHLHPHPHPHAPARAWGRGS